MRYSNLHDLINSSSSTRKYFLSLPVNMQISLHEHNDYIHTAAELHRMAGIIENYEHHCKLSDGI
ncbi:MAG: hypothetical protein IJ470_01790 [Clostridia bacterium]|nr:hypothetical protein [Clostridia bacterium]